MFRLYTINRASVRCGSFTVLLTIVPISCRIISTGSLFLLSSSSLLNKIQNALPHIPEIVTSFTCHSQMGSDTYSYANLLISFFLTWIFSSAMLKLKNFLDIIQHGQGILINKLPCRKCNGGSPYSFTSLPIKNLLPKSFDSIYAPYFGIPIS